jgi:putative transposase
VRERPGKRNRRSIRLGGHDYRLGGSYFITICAAERRPLFSDPGVRRLVEETWLQVPQHFDGVAVDQFVVMPNHFHGIVVLGRAAVGAQHAAPLHGPVVHAGSLGAIVRSFKSAATKQARQSGSVSGDVWQRNYYERIIRNDAELNRIREYIALNPTRWEFDRDNPARTIDSVYEREWRWLEAPLRTKVHTPASDISP